MKTPTEQIEEILLTVHKAGKNKDEGAILIPARNELLRIINERDKIVLEKERERIFSEYIIAGSMLTMYQTEKSIHWTAEELRKAMIRICKIKVPEKK